MEETKMTETTAETTEEAKTEEVKKTLDDYLKDPDIQSQFDKKLESSKAKWEKKWQEKVEAEKSEAERLANMTAEEKQQEAINNAINLKNKAEAELNAYKLKEEAQKIALEKGLDMTLLNVLDYSKETAETVKSKIDDLEKVFKKAIENGINDKLKQSSPVSVSTSGSKTDVEKYLDDKYKNSPYYKK